MKETDIVQWNNSIITASVFIFFGLTTFITSFHKLNRGTIFITAVVLTAGIILGFACYFEILDPQDILLSSVLFVIGGGLLVLFIDNPGEQIFLYLSLVLFAFSFTAVYFQKSHVVIEYANKATSSLYDFWPVLLLFLGIIFITGKRK